MRTGLEPSCDNESRCATVVWNCSVSATPCFDGRTSHPNCSMVFFRRASEGQTRLSEHRAGSRTARRAHFMPHDSAKCNIVNYGALVSHRSCLVVTMVRTRAQHTVFHLITQSDQCDSPPTTFPNDHAPDDAHRQLSKRALHTFKPKHCASKCQTTLRLGGTQRGLGPSDIRLLFRLVLLLLAIKSSMAPSLRPQAREASSRFR